MDGGHGAEDILAQGSEREPRFTLPDWRPSRAASGLAAVTLLAGLAVGYVVGHQQGGHATAKAASSASPSPSSTVQGPPTITPDGQVVYIEASTGQITATLAAGAPAATQGIGTCSDQVGQDLELGIPVTNNSGQAMALNTAEPRPLMSGMLKVLGWQWGPCGYNSAGLPLHATLLMPGQTVWLTGLFKPQVACPGPAPVQFDVTYTTGQQHATVTLPGFPDLAGVSYSGCKGQG